jgi:hypothetical protein
MSTRSPLSPEVRALLERERVIPPVSASQRARAMARARASLATLGVATTAPSGTAPRTRWVAAAAAAMVVGASVVAAAYEIRARMAPTQAARPAAIAPVSEVVARAPAASPPAVAVADPVPTSLPAVEAPALSLAGAAGAELRLLRQARSAVAHGDFAAALSPIAEHTRRFKNGRLAEEREALRVRALAGLGRTEEARRAAAAFRVRFPRSVLLPAISQMPASGR